jgi:hypothetical protein
MRGNLQWLRFTPLPPPPLAPLWTPHAISLVVQWSAPEVCAGDTMGTVVTTASDVYMLGGLLYELLTGRVPFHWIDETVLRHRRVSEGAVSLVRLGSFQGLYGKSVLEAALLDREAVPWQESLRANPCHRAVFDGLVALMVECLAKEARSRPKLAAVSVRVDDLLGALADSGDRVASEGATRALQQPMPGYGCSTSAPHPRAFTRLCCITPTVPPFQTPYHPPPYPHGLPYAMVCMVRPVFDSLAIVEALTVCGLSAFADAATVLVLTEYRDRVSGSQLTSLLALLSVSAVGVAQMRAFLLQVRVEQSLKATLLPSLPALQPPSPHSSWSCEPLLLLICFPYPVQVYIPDDHVSLVSLLIAMTACGLDATLIERTAAQLLDSTSVPVADLGVALMDLGLEPLEVHAVKRRCRPVAQAAGSAATTDGSLSPLAAPGLSCSACSPVCIETQIWLLCEPCFFVQTPARERSKL